MHKTFFTDLVTFEIILFVYKEYDIKVSLKLNFDESLVTYNRIQYYTFVSKKSIGDPRITVLNFPLVVSSHAPTITIALVYPI